MQKKKLKFKREEELSEGKRERGGSVLRRRIPLGLFMDRWAALTNIIGPILILFF